MDEVIKKEDGVIEDIPPSNFTLFVLGLASICVLVPLIMLIVGHTTGPEVYEVPEVITQLLDEMIENNAVTDEMLDKYFDLSWMDEEDLEIEDTYQEFNRVSLEYVFFDFSPKVSSYEITSVSLNYVEIICYKYGFIPIYPRIALAYRLNEDGTKIEDYTVGRLQPFSTKSEEYDEQWSS